ncbi:hypothetical protein BC831DRAFT_457702 [Entophlyctis helioformis]|nr:hypothetical protein BC831DRAFT_457702 [Entophlyctis helioformis]
MNAPHLQHATALNAGSVQPLANHTPHLNVQQHQQHLQQHPQHQHKQHQLRTGSASSSSSSSLSSAPTAAAAQGQLATAQQQQQRQHEQQQHRAESSSSDPFSESQIDGLVDRIRVWRDNALDQKLLDTAEFWGDKALTMSGDPMDAFRLAQVFFHTEQHVRTQRLLAAHSLDVGSTWGRHLAAKSAAKLGRWDNVLDILKDKEAPRLPAATCSRLQRLDMQLHELNGKCIRIEASISHLRGLAHLHQGSKPDAKAEFMKALETDVRCFDAFNALLENHWIMSGSDASILSTLRFDELGQPDAQFVRLLYETRLAQVAPSASHPLAHSSTQPQIRITEPASSTSQPTSTATGTIETSSLQQKRSSEESHSLLGSRFRLAENADVLLAQAHKHYTFANIDQALIITTAILLKDPFNVACLPLHIALLHASGKKSVLFVLAHQLVETIPKSHITWFAVATYYIHIGKHAEARAYYTKAAASMPDFAPGWIGFGHTFALENEHDQAMSAYSTVLRDFPSLYIPRLFLGMEYLHSSTNMGLTEHYLTSAYALCNSDPLLLNELGVMYYRKREFKTAIMYFEQVIDQARQLNIPMQLWDTTLSNLGQAYRKLGDYESAQRWFHEVLEFNPQHAPTLTSLGLIAHAEDRLSDAIDLYHQAMALDADDALTSELLRRALDDQVASWTFPRFDSRNLWGMSDAELDRQLADRFELRELIDAEEEADPEDDVDMQVQDDSVDDGPYEDEGAELGSERMSGHVIDNKRLAVPFGMKLRQAARNHPSLMGTAKVAQSDGRGSFADTPQDIGSSVPGTAGGGNRIAAPIPAMRHGRLNLLSNLGQSDAEGSPAFGRSSDASFLGREPKRGLLDFSSAIERSVVKESPGNGSASQLQQSLFGLGGGGGGSGSLAANSSAAFSWTNQATPRVAASDVPGGFAEAREQFTAASHAASSTLGHDAPSVFDTPGSQTPPPSMQTRPNMFGANFTLRPGVAQRQHAAPAAPAHAARQLSLSPVGAAVHDLSWGEIPSDFRHALNGGQPSHQSSTSASASVAHSQPALYSRSGALSPGMYRNRSRSTAEQNTAGSGVWDQSGPSDNDEDMEIDDGDDGDVDVEGGDDA